MDLTSKIIMAAVAFGLLNGTAILKTKPAAADSEDVSYLGSIESKLGNIESKLDSIDSRLANIDSNTERIR